MKKLWLITGVLWCSVCLASEVKVVDGDSLEIDGARIRLDGIDAPEFFQVCEDKNAKKYDCGQDSAAYLRNLIGTQTPRCECEPHLDPHKNDIQKQQSACLAAISRSKQFLRDFPPTYQARQRP